MDSKKSVAHRLGRVLETVTRQSGRLPDTPEYGSWLLGKTTESQLRRRVRIQVILTVFILSANMVGIGAALLLVGVAFPVPSVARSPGGSSTRYRSAKRESVWRPGKRSPEMSAPRSVSSTP